MSIFSNQRSNKILFFIVAICPALFLLYAAVNNNLGPDPAEALADSTGEWALRFLLLTLAVSPLRQLTGKVVVTQYRRMIGLFVFFYGILHFLVYLFFLLALQWQDLFDDILERPYITVGFTAFLLLIPLAITSTSKARRRMGRTWNKLHKLVYVVAILSLIHLWWQLRSDAIEVVIYAAIFVILMLFRLPKMKTMRFKN